MPLFSGIFWQGALLVVAGAVGLALIAPDAYEQLAQEDGIIEWGTFVSFAAASIILLAVARREKSWSRLFFFGLAGFCFFVAGEEISWGQRLFAFQPPKVFLEHNYQQEANLHNLLKNILDTRWIVLAIALFYGCVLPLIAKRLPATFQRARQDTDAKRRAGERSMGLQPLAPAAWLIPSFASVVLIEAIYPFELSGEVAELALGLCFLAEAISRLGAKLPAIPLAQIACMVVATALVPITDRLLYGDDTMAAEHTRADLDRLAAAIAEDGVARSKLFHKRRVHKRVFTAVRAGYLRLGPEWGYFLDAWNQPLWIETERVSRGCLKASVYSFGPNRRRDADDIRVPISLACR